MPQEPATIWWASLMVGRTRHVYVLTPFIGTEARFAAQRELRCWDQTGATPIGSYSGYGHALAYDGGRWGIGKSTNTPVRFAAAALADDEYSKWWAADPATIITGAATRLQARKDHLLALGRNVPSNLADAETFCWNIIDNRLPSHPRTAKVKQWYQRWLDSSDPIIEGGSQWTHAYNREYTVGDRTWLGADIAEYLTIAQEMAALGWQHPVRVADAAAEIIFASWIIRAVQGGSLAYGSI